MKINFFFFSKKKQLIVEPLRQRSKDRQRAIIGQYECANIFMNIDELVTVTEDFYNDLVQYNLYPKGRRMNLGELCLSHVNHQYSIYICKYFLLFFFYKFILRCVVLLVIIDSCWESITHKLSMKSN